MSILLPACVLPAPCFATRASIFASVVSKVLSVNVKGYSWMMKHCIPAMRGRGKGSIVNLASVSAHRAQAKFIPYSTSKGAIMQMTRCVALDCGVDNIRVNTYGRCDAVVLVNAFASLRTPGRGQLARLWN